MLKWPHLKIASPIGTRLGLLIQNGTLHMFMQSKVRYQVRLIRHQIIRQTLVVKFTLFEKLKSNWTLTQFIDKILEPLHVHRVKDHK